MCDEIEGVALPALSLLMFIEPLNYSKNAIISHRTYHYIEEHEG